MHRFFLSPGDFQQGEVSFPPSVSHQIGKVLRLRSGERVIALDNSGWEYEVELLSPERGRVVGKTPAGGEPRTRLILYQALLKARKFELALQKATEVGVAAFVPFFSRRCEVPLPPAEGKRKRWEVIIREAAEQSQRGRLPQLYPTLPFSEACRQAPKPSLIFWEGEREATLETVLSPWQLWQEIGLFIGPEGGFDPEEIALARGMGLQTVGLGPRILRAETAAVVTAALLLHRLGEL